MFDFIERLVRMVLGFVVILVLLYVVDHFLGTDLLGVVQGGVRAAVDFCRHLFN